MHADEFELYGLQVEVACPDPHCPTRFRITRLGKRLFKHSDTTAVPLPPGL